MMNKDISSIGFDEAIQAGSKMEYVLLYMMSEMIFCKGTEINLEQVDFGECLEARFFGPHKEIHLYRTEGGWKAVLTEEVTDLDHIDRKYRLSKKHQNAGLGSELVVREYIGYDDDGQAYIVKTRLAGVC